jgi:hypothetical protein
MHEGERAVAVFPFSRDPFVGGHIRNILIRIYLAVNEPDKALDQLEAVLQTNSYITPGLAHW